ncbi:hypothetical protein [Spirosoma flavum]|uniref:Lipocalin-like domain-containing protein n=1 Tax=Spirosoma flavum TaxID=2048557 RepID=A0ABW6AA34_9BACT
MTSRKSKLIVALTIGLILGCEHKDCGCVQPPAPLEGEWTLTKITYSLTQKTVTAAEAGYAETLSFRASSDTKGTYRRARNGIPSQTSDYSLSFPNGGSSEGSIYFLADTTQQTFRLTDNKLYLSEISPVGVTIADGSTYEYQRQ